MSLSKSDYYPLRQMNIENVIRQIVNDSKHFLKET